MAEMRLRLGDHFRYVYRGETYTSRAVAFRAGRPMEVKRSLWPLRFHPRWFPTSVILNDRRGETE